MTAARTLASICQRTRQAHCGQCWARPAEPCTGSRGECHLARYRRASRSGLITLQDLAVVLDAAGPGAASSTMVPAVKYGT